MAACQIMDEPKYTIIPPIFNTVIVCYELLLITYKNWQGRKFKHGYQPRILLILCHWRNIALFKY